MLRTTHHYARNGTVIGLVTSHYRVRSKESAPNWYDAIKDAIEYVSENYAADLSVADLARRANLSESQFTRIFRRQTETSPAQYIVQTRINAARTLLETTDKLLTDIAAETGFCTASHLSNTFRAATGFSPRVWRSRI